MKTFLALVMAMLITGCSKCDNNDPTGTSKGTNYTVQPKIQPTSSTARDAIEGMTGKTAVDQGKKAQDKIRAISAEQNRKLNEVLNDK